MTDLTLLIVDLTKVVSSLPEYNLSHRAVGAGQDLRAFEVDNQHGLDALKRIFTDIVGQQLSDARSQGKQSYKLVY